MINNGFTKKEIEFLLNAKERQKLCEEIDRACKEIAKENEEYNYGKRN